MSLLAVAAWFELFDGTQTIAMGCIRGLKDAKTTFLVGLGCYWLIGAPAAWWMAFGFYAQGGAMGVWWGLALGLACAALRTDSGVRKEDEADDSAGAVSQLSVSR